MTSNALKAQCAFNSLCPLAPIEIEAAAGMCEVMVTITVPSASNPLDPTEVCTVNASHSTGLFPIGTTTVEFTLANGAICTQDIIISEFGGAISSVACNDLVQLSLDENCEVVVTPDDITEGGPYGCFDLFQVSISGVIGNTITVPGTYTVTITTPAGNSCWGQVLVEDKLGPVLDCVNDTTTCSQGTFPGDIIRDFAKAEVLATPITPGSAIAPAMDVISFTLPPAHPDAVVDELIIKLDVEHASITDLSATLTGPSGTVIDLFTSPGLTSQTSPCDVPDMSIKFKENAPYTHADLQAMCGVGNHGAIGWFVPQDAFDALYGEDPDAGPWELTIINSGTLAGTVTLASMHVGYMTGIIDFPLDGNFITYQGSNQFIFDDGTACSPVSLVYNDSYDNTECAGMYWSTITRTWTGVDPSGNTSGCTQIIYVEREDLSAVKFPPNYDGFDHPSFYCFDDLDLNDEGNPDITETGVPHNPSGSFCPNIQYTYEDLRIDVCPGAYKVIRKWSILDWCTQEVIEHDQIIKVEDKHLPIFECPITDDVINITDPYSCSEDYVVPIPVLTNPEYECNDITWNVQWKASAPLNGQCLEPADTYYSGQGVEPFGNSYIIYDLPEGCVWIKYEVEDACGNRYEQICEVMVMDGTAPVAVCIEFTVASLGANGYAKIYAESFDNGSWDNCMLESIDVRRMEDNCHTPPITYFRPFVEFCCVDLDDNPHMVEFRVTDKKGLTNTCMVEVTVQDKLPPVLQCPDDVTLDCADGIGGPEHLGWPIVVDNTLECVPVDTTWEDIGDPDQCGSGLIERHFRVQDLTNPNLFGTCIQYIYLHDTDPFYINRNNDNDPNDDVDWPPNVTVTECFSDLHPDNLGDDGYPKLYDDECSLVAATYKDQVFTFVPDACEKVIRTWTVIDWCQFEEAWPTQDPNGNGIQDGIWEYVQIIKLVNENAPTILDCDDRTFCAYGECNGDIVYRKTGEDDCTEADELKWSYEVDINNDGTFESIYAGNTSDASGVYPLGTHLFKWTLEDYCGNITTCKEEVTIEDCKNPTPYCISQISTAVMNSNGQLELWASDFDLDSYDNCTDQEDLIFSFSTDITDTNILLTCDDIPNGMESEIELQIWVTDENGNQDYCEVTIVLQDNNSDICNDNAVPLIDISGTIRTEDNRMVEDAMIQVMKNGTNDPNVDFTSNDGSYNYINLQANNNYDISVSLNSNVLNGVSTLDLVFMQKHILGLQLLDSPYKIIAADVDGNEKVSSIDIVNLRKVILGILDEFPFGMPSWKFVDSDFEFPDANDPFPYTEIRTLYNVSANKYYEDFIAVKMGDVTYNAVTNLTGDVDAENRGNRDIAFSTDMIDFEEGDLVRVPVYMNQLDAILGFQFNLEFNKDNAKFNGLVSGSLDIDEDNYNMYKNILSVSWDNVEGQEIDTKEPLFYIELIAQADASIVETLELVSNTLSSEIYDTDAVSYPLELEFRNAEEVGEFYLLEQNRPNPFSTTTDIVFYLPKESNVVFNIYDLAGKIVKTERSTYAAGKNVITLNAAELNITGVMYYSVETEEWSSTKKMIVIK